ncbi:glutathione synthase [Paxillus ammoniavirescens]|nr:glutathione synthase [Paxillus ammoniavirescens]
MTTTFDFSQWPPSLTDAQLETLTHHATTYALSHGLTYLPPTPTQPSSPSSAIHAPISLLPAPVPRSLFEETQRLQSVYNTLYARVATNDDFLDREMGADEGVGKADEFVRTLWKGWKDIRDEGIIQPLHLGLFRSDYLLHTGGGDGTLSVKQVEFNTISSSFGPLSERAAAMHRYLHALTNYYDISPHLKPENFPINNTTSGLAQGLAEAHEAYGVTGAYILFVVQPNERNVFDQRWLEYELLENHSVRVIRQTFAELSSSAKLDPETRVLRLTITSAAPNSSTLIEISTVYFRAGYVPTDFPTEEHYKTRFTLERSRAIKCPTIPLQLAGGKKIQEVLSQPGIVETFFSSPSDTIVNNTTDGAAGLRDTWMRMWALDSPNPPVTPSIPSGVHQAADEPLGTALARTSASSLVLKPQREGGGNNVYKSDIPAFLDTLAADERQAWIAMELIVPPAGVGGYLVRAGGAGDSAGASWEKIVRAETVSELGVFGWALFGKEGIVKERGDVGWLMRTKGVESNEGGVAAGFSVLDSVVLVDG